MDRAEIERRLRQAEDDLRKAEAQTYRLQGAVAVLKGLLADESAPAAEGDQ